MNKILCSTGAITGKVNNYNYRLLEPLSGQLMCDGFELMMDRPWYDDLEALKTFLLKMNLYIPVVHSEKHIGEMISKGSDANIQEAFKMFEMDCDVARSIGANKLVLHLWGGRASDSNFQNNSKAYPHLYDTARKYELELLVENVVCNVENPMKHLCELREKFPHIQFVYDTKMAAFHEQTDLLYEPEYEWLWKENHICHYHVNDYAGGYKDWANLRTLPIGKGKVDFNRFFHFISRIDYKGDFTVEATAFDDEGVIDTDMLNGQFRYIRKILDK